jgi:hypothetical protein
VHAREQAASVAQYVLLGGFAAVAAGISAQGLTGFARSNKELSGAWPYLLFFALDGAAGVCAVLLVRRAARAESSLAPRLAVWGLVAASTTFNWTHAPRCPAAAEAFGLMPVVAALLFEFCLRELRLRTLAGRTGRALSAWRWLHPAERIRVQICMAADEQVSAEAATRHVRVDHAARRLYQLKIALFAHVQSHAHGAMAAHRVRQAERRAHRALTRAGFADPATAIAALDQEMIGSGLATESEAVFDLDFHAVLHWGADPVLEKHYVPTRSQRARSVLTFFAQDTGTHNLVYANADISKATQAREAITFCDHWKAVSGADPKMLIMDQKVTTQKILGELHQRGVKFATLRMRSRSLTRYINSLAPGDFTTITLDRPGPHNRPRVHQDPAVTLTRYPGTVRQLIVTGLGREEPTVIITKDGQIKTRALVAQ